MKQKNDCCCSSAHKNENSLKSIIKPPHWHDGIVKTTSGDVVKVKPELSFNDFLGSLMVRMSIGRSSYKVNPGLYAINNPDKTSFVFVTANYKLSFDSLRKELKGIDGWILVLDTKGINVWCAAGKGTFGTSELVRQIEQTRLKEIVDIRKVILPQLGGPGVAAHMVKKMTGFSVLYGPVRAKHLPAFLNNNLKASGKMREVSFSLVDRFLLTPVELAGTLKYSGLAYLLFIIYMWILTGSASISQILLSAFFLFFPFFGAVLVGTVLVPLLLPFIPGKAFAWKGWLGGLIWTAVYLFVFNSTLTWIHIVSYGLLLPAIASFLMMNFTGATSYTSLSGVLHEMKIALPLIFISASCGVVFFVVDKVLRLLA